MSLGFLSRTSALPPAVIAVDSSIYWAHRPPVMMWCGGGALTATTAAHRQSWSPVMNLPLKPADMTGWTLEAPWLWRWRPAAWRGSGGDGCWNVVTAGEVNVTCSGVITLTSFTAEMKRRRDEEADEQCQLSPRPPPLVTIIARSHFCLPFPIIKVWLWASSYPPPTHTHSEYNVSFTEFKEKNKHFLLFVRKIKKVELIITFRFLSWFHLLLSDIIKTKEGVIRWGSPETTLPSGGCFVSYPHCEARSSCLKMDYDSLLSSPPDVVMTGGSAHSRPFRLLSGSPAALPSSL